MTIQVSDSDSGLFKFIHDYCHPANWTKFAHYRLKIRNIIEFCDVQFLMQHPLLMRLLYYKVQCSRGVYIVFTKLDEDEFPTTLKQIIKYPLETIFNMIKNQ